MYAIIETGGKQYRIAEGQTVSIEKLEAAPGSEVVFGSVLCVCRDDGSVFGKPYLEKATVKAEVLSEGKGRKVWVFKQLPRKNSRKLRGHRQPFMDVRIKEINFGG